MVASSRRLVWRVTVTTAVAEKINAVDKGQRIPTEPIEEGLNRCCSTETFPQDSALVFAFSEVPGRSEQSYLFQKRRGLNDSLSVGRVQLLDIDAVVRLLSARCSRYPGVSCGSIMYAFRRLLKCRKNEAAVR